MSNKFLLIAYYLYPVCSYKPDKHDGTCLKLLLVSFYGIGWFVLSDLGGSSVSVNLGIQEEVVHCSAYFLDLPHV